jgi:transcription elongation factor GreA
LETFLFLSEFSKYNFMSVNYMTKEGLEKLRAQLAEMKGKGRAEIAKQIAEAREKGDLSENAEYDAAKEAQGLHELKISQLETALSTARILEEGDVDTSQVSVLTTVEIKEMKSGKKIKYTLVSEKEADLKAGKISVGSPIGQGLLGKKVGEIAEIKTPGGIMNFEVLSISL